VAEYFVDFWAITKGLTPSADIPLKQLALLQNHAVNGMALSKNIRPQPRSAFPISIRHPLVCPVAAHAFLFPFEGCKDACPSSSCRSTQDKPADCPVDRSWTSPAGQPIC